MDILPSVLLGLKFPNLKHSVRRGEKLEIRLENTLPKAADFFENKFGEYAAERGDFFGWGGGELKAKKTLISLFSVL